MHIILINSAYAQSRLPCLLQRQKAAANACRDINVTNVM